MSSIYTVGQVNAYIKKMFVQDFMLNRIAVKGEVSNCKYHRSGHIYFSLKDETGTMACVMFAGARRGLAFQMKDGDKVVAEGSVDVYERDGRYQLYARRITLEGAGLLYERFLALKAELEEMGMFAPEYKQPIPAYVRRLGIVTAPTGAAVRDIQNIALRRNPFIQLILFPALVQGQGAAESIVKGIKALDRLGLDAIIVGRGGGSIEDLWAFNEEAVARAIFECKTPVISAVGHETDTTIADFAADLRAPTPSAAESIVKGIKALDRLGLDAIIVGRGGGSIEDLWAFNEEAVARAIFECKTPVISAVGHETDTTIADFAADLRAPTPSAAAELAVADVRGILESLAQYRRRLRTGFCRVLEGERDRLLQYRTRWNFLSPENQIREKRQRLADAEQQLRRKMENRIREARHRLQLSLETFRVLSPLAKLNQGLAYLENPEGRAVTSIRDTSPGELLTIRVRDGSIRSLVQTLEPWEDPGADRADIFTQ